MDTEELLRQMELDDLEDRLEEQKVATPRDYARSRGIAPQLVYYRIRNHQLETHTCPCGRRVVNIEEADAIFRPKPDTESGGEDLPEEEEVPGSDVDAG
jgi:hypothetical protein